MPMLKEVILTVANAKVRLEMSLQVVVAGKGAIAVLMRTDLVDKLAISLGFFSVRKREQRTNRLSAFRSRAWPRGARFLGCCGDP